MAFGDKVKFTPQPSGYMLSSGIRIGLCLIVLTFTYQHFERFDNSQSISSAVLLYLAYSILLFVDAWRGGPTAVYARRYGPWVDGVFITALTAISGGFNSPFNFLFFFAIIDAATSQRFATSIKTMTALTMALTAVSIATMTPPTTVFDIVVSLPVLFILGLIIAYRSGLQRELKQRLSLIQQITAVASPKIGLERSIGVTLSLLRTHFDADDCILVSRDDHTHEASFFRAQQEPLTEVDGGSEMPVGAFLDRLLALSAYHAVLFDGRDRLFRKPKVTAVCANSLQFVEPGGDDTACLNLSEVLDAPQFISVPINTGRGFSGRIFIIKSQKARRFHAADIRLTLQVTSLLTPLIENARLIDRISSSAAEEERKRIARDIHDSIIQPYLGLKLGLESVSGLIDQSDGNFTEVRTVIKERIGNLEALADATVENMRGLVQGLSDSRASGNTLLPSVKRFAEKFAGATGINVHVVSDGDMRAADKLAPDVFQLAVEGLSNIRKHTTSPNAVIALNASEEAINLKITNEGTTDRTFRPRSITERVSELKGTVEILKGDGSCTVDISIPI